MKLAISCDHVGIILKNPIKDWLTELGYEIIDFGANSEERTDYPIYGKLVGEAISEGKADLGIVFCGTGVGISLSANKVSGIRAVVCSEPYSAKLSKEHNNTNVLALGSRVVGLELAKMIITEWIKAEFEGGRHQDRINMYK
ncbi:Ribose 5-phosphate isomerase B [Mesoplasma florum W37]|uniref:Ribose 5-phosphate isomerase B n=1 Tax=Mesoplasma florum TaxID=2151 RepID=A0AAD2JDG3_MESFO|nr:ribose 5-phosphate isomerase B [Mesoplasma florum]AGY41380.1 Ribose 5-phosphate isomerase B [Mesoplasma florum W37]AVN59603.1 ribose 5-phosphate isomerase B [Mesoplasma florum]AVN65720.1 Ribose 5-phosphate isomerase B [Mesoplasma florum]